MGGHFPPAHVNQRCDVCTGDILVALGVIFKKENRPTREPCTPHSSVQRVLRHHCGFWLLCFERCRRRFDLTFDFEFVAMPGHDSCVVPGCPNRPDRCNWGLFPGAAPVAG